MEESRGPMGFHPDVIEQIRKLNERGNLGSRLRDLVFTGNFYVEDVRGTYIHRNRTPIEQRPLDLTFDSEDLGYTRLLKLTVGPSTHATPVRHLEFIGESPVEAGDRVVAMIPRFTSRQIFEGRQKRIVYDPREYASTEKAIFLEVIRGGKSIRADESKDYHLFMED